MARVLFISVVLSVLAFLLAIRLRSSSPPPPPPPSSPSLSRKCEFSRNQRIRFPRYFPLCIIFDKVTKHSVHARLFPSYRSIEVTLQPFTRFVAEHILKVSFNCSISNTHNTCKLSFLATNLLPDTDYLLTVNGFRERGRNLLCQSSFSTLPENGNLVLNSGFEQAGDAPFMPTRFFRSEQSTPRMWTPFYNGGLRISCGIIQLPHGGFLHPRSGRCCAQLGYSGAQLGDDNGIQKFFGAHSAIPLSKYNRTAAAFYVGAWYRFSTDMTRIVDSVESPHDSLSMIISWTWDDGTVDDGVVLSFVIDSTVTRWTLLCAYLDIPNGYRLTNIHIYIHRHDRKYGTLFVDDVFVHPLSPESVMSGEKCQIVKLNETTSTVFRNDSITSSNIHLKAAKLPSEKQLTLVVPCTVNRALRLETLARLYGGGPVAAVVLVKDTAEALKFAKMWKRKPWMRHHVDVQFVRLVSEMKGRTPIPINALRNVALRLARTEFVAMLDVDMTPATDEFACFRDIQGIYLTSLLPRKGRTIVAVPVFLSAQNQRSATSKAELMNIVGMQKGTSYCLNSLKPFRTWRWYSESESYDLRFMSDFEPYGVGRRDDYPQFDERFVGYGFNKISWILDAERSGYKILASTTAFVTHLNHVENDWVESINVAQYLNTWRRYFSFVAERS